MQSLLARESRTDLALDHAMLDRYLAMYANADTLSPPDDVRRAIEEMYKRARAAGLIKSTGPRHRSKRSKWRDGAAWAEGEAPHVNTDGMGLARASLSATPTPPQRELDANSARARPSFAARGAMGG